MLKDLPNSSLVQAALVSQNMEVMMHMVTPGCSETSRNKVTPDLHEAHDTALTYLHSMSCIGQPHPYASKHIQRMKQEFEVDITIETAKVAGITYEALHDLLNFSGTELLLIDAEGQDCQILRSMIEYCKTKNNSAWPNVIQFETQGICDIIDATNSEDNMISTLGSLGYLVVYRGEWHSGRAREEYHTWVNFIWMDEVNQVLLLW